MKGSNHLIGGVATAGCIVTSALIENKVGLIPIAGMGIAAIIGSLFPDIDSRTSKLGKKLKLTSIIVSKCFGHRGFFHSPLFIALTYLGCWFAFNHYNITDYSYIYLGFAAGMLMHLACDATTKGGIPLLYPWSKGKFSIGVLKSGNKYEKVSLWFLIILAIGLTIVMIYNGIYPGIIPLS